MNYEREKARIKKIIKRVKDDRLSKYMQDEIINNAHSYLRSLKIKK